MTASDAQPRRRPAWLPLALVVVAVAGLAVLPRFGSYFTVLLATEILIFALLTVSFNLLFGYTGLLSFGHAAFFGAGAYAAALLMRDFQADFVLVLLVALLVGSLLALVFGLLSVRLDEVYFAMLTLAFGMIMYAFAFQWRSFTGGSDGITGFKLSSVAWLDLNLANPHTFYYVTLVVVVLAIFVLYRITLSHFGLLLRALRENRERVEFAGIPAYRYRLYAFVISGAFAGLAGALYGPFLRVATPDTLHWTTSAEPVVMAVLGGSGVFLGPAIGAASYLLLKNLITGYTQHWMLVLGILLGLIVILFPKGLFGSLLAWLRLDRGRQA